MSNKISYNDTIETSVYSYLSEFNISDYFDGENEWNALDESQQRELISEWIQDEIIVNWNVKK